MHVKAILFDLDGTIIDTSELVYQSYEYSLEFHKYPLLTREQLSTYMGKPLRVTYQELVQQQDVQHLFTVHDEFQLENMHLAVPFKKLEKVLKTFKAKNIKMAVVTARGRSSTISILQTNNLLDYFDTIITFDEVTNSKPDPEGIQLALKQLGISKEEAIMTGDTDADILAGKNAGVRTIGVTYGFHGEAIKELKPDYTIDSIGEILDIALQ